MNKQQILDFTSAFPPAQKLIQTLMEIDYQKNYNSFMDAVIVVCAFVAAIYTIAREKWVEYEMTTRCQIAFDIVKEHTIIAYNWIRNVAIPFVRETAIPFIVDTVNEIRSLRNTLQLATL